MWDPISFRRRPRAPGTSLGERNGPTIQAFKTKALQFASLPPLSTPACGCGEGRKACRPKSHRFIGLYGWPISFPKGGCQELWAPFERKDPLACALKPPPGTEPGRCLRDEAVVAWCPSGRPQRRGFTGLSFWLPLPRGSRGRVRTGIFHRESRVSMPARIPGFVRGASPLAGNPPGSTGFGPGGFISSVAILACRHMWARGSCDVQ